MPKEINIDDETYEEFNDDYNSWDAETLKAFLSGNSELTANEMVEKLGSNPALNDSNGLKIGGFTPLEQPNHAKQNSKNKKDSPKIQPIQIISENENWLIINKPPYIPSLPERGKYTAESVMEWARKKWADSILCHRLDRETSGCLIIAKNAEAYRHISIQFEKRQIIKRYHAVVDGKVGFNDLWVDLPINTENVLKIRIDKQNGKQAQTLFNTIQNFNHFTLIECQPKTGRLHQIRVHLASQNAKIAGDILYGSQIPKLSLIKRKFSGDDTVLMPRFALHARNLEFTDLNGEICKVQADYPKDFAVFLKLLNKYDQ
jgi:23S rRNA pseudouridine955/2504/2580 synthase